MGYIEKNLLSDEKVIHKTRLNKIILFLPSIFLLTCGLILILQADVDKAIGGFVLIIGLYSVVRNMLVFYCTEFAVTDMRIVIKKGLIRRSTVELFLTKIEGINLQQSILDRILNMGAIIVTGTGGKPQKFIRIDDPVRLRNAVQNQLTQIYFDTGVHKNVG